MQRLILGIPASADRTSDRRTPRKILRKARIAQLFMICPLVASPVWPQGSPTPQSSTIQALARQIADGHANAVSDFWSQIARQHTPVIEPDSPNYSLVTFVWRGDQETKNVVVITPLALINFSEAILQNLPGTDVWYKTYHMRNDAHMSYRFAVNDSLVPVGQDPDFFARMKSWQLDANNPLHSDVGLGIIASVLELPGAPTDKWTRNSPGAAEGSLDKYEFRSDLLHNQRPAWLYTPANFDPAISYPLLVIMDGDSYISLVPMPTILDNLIAARMIPPVIAVLLGNAPDNAREVEMNCNQTWSDSLVKEVLPWLRTRHNLKFTDANVTIIGDSLSGLAAACVARDYPKVFSKVISQSGSYYRAPAGDEPEWLARHLAADPPIPVQFYLEIGLLETASIPSRDPSMLTANRHLRDVLTAKGNRIRYVEHYSGHEHLSWRATIPDALIYTLKPQ
jgi:enterochelin esterase family protein